MLRIALVLFALVAGGAAAWLALNMRSEPAPGETIVLPATPVAMQEVLVASADLGPGQRLNKDNMRWQSWPPGVLNPAYITRSARPDALETLADSYVRSRMNSGEPIRDDKLLPADGGFLSTLLPPGKRAVAVRISAETTAGGFILPRDRVDVLLTTDPQREGEQHMTGTILRNVPVLAIDQSVDDRNDAERGNAAKAATIVGTKPAIDLEPKAAKGVTPGKTATLELGPLEVEILANAQASGTISLSLRSAADNGDRTYGILLRNKQTVRLGKFAGMQVLQITTTKAPVQAWATSPSEPQQKARPKTFQVQRDSSRFAIR
jgi:pilus assembly protein CpaB